MFCKISLHKIVLGTSKTASWRATSGNKIMQTDDSDVRLNNIVSAFCRILFLAPWARLTGATVRRPEHGGSPLPPRPRGPVIARHPLTATLTGFASRSVPASA